MLSIVLALAAAQWTTYKFPPASATAETVAFSCYLIQFTTGRVEDLQRQDRHLFGLSFPSKMTFGAAKVFDPNGLIRNLASDFSSFNNVSGAGSAHFGADNPDGLMVTLRRVAGTRDSYDAMILTRREPPKDKLRQSEWMGRCSAIPYPDPANPFASLVGKAPVMKVGQ